MLVSFIAALIYNLLCMAYFNVGRSQFIFNAVYFIVGGAIYLYREKIVSYVSSHKVYSTIGVII